MIGWALATAALAQDPIATGSVQQLHTSVDGRRTLWVDDASVARPGAVQLRVLGSYAVRPLRVDDVAVVRGAFQADVAAAVTAGRARLGLVVPVLAGVTSDVDDVAPAGLSDVGVDLKYTLLDPDTAPLGLALKARVGVPVPGVGVTGLSSRAPTLESGLVLDGEVGPVHLLGNLGVRVGPAAMVDGQPVGDAAVGRFGVAVPFLDGRVGAAAELGARVGVTAPLAGTTPIEAALTGWFRPVDALAVRAGFGRWIVDGFGASPARLMVGLSTRPRSRTEGRPGQPVDEPEPTVGASQLGADRDQDGVIDAIDRCLREPEDVDGFEDDDGCPEDVRLGVRIQASDGAIAHGAFGVLRCNGGEKLRLMPDEVIDVPEGSCVLDAVGIGWSARKSTRWIDNGPPVEWRVELEPEQPMTRLVLDVTSADGAPLEEVLWSVGAVYGRVTDGRVAMALPVGTYPVRVKARGTGIHEQEVTVDADGMRLPIVLERE